MTKKSDLHALKIAMIGALGAISTAAVGLIAIVSYFAVAERVERSRSDEAATRLQRQAADIIAGRPMAQPWLNPDLQRATQEAQLSQYARRTISTDDGEERVAYAIPIGHAMEMVLQEAEGKASEHSQTEGTGP